VRGRVTLDGCTVTVIRATDGEIGGSYYNGNSDDGPVQGAEVSLGPGAGASASAMGTDTVICTLSGCSGPPSGSGGNNNGNGGGSSPPWKGM